MRLALTLSLIDSPIGPLALACDAEGRLRGLSFGEGVERQMRREYPQMTARRGAAPADVKDAFDAYFGGDRGALARAPWSLAGATSEDAFQGRVWRELACVLAGATVSYGEMARRAGEPGAARSAGVALNRNPIALVLPCHRVVGADGGLVGFGGGLARKQWLLKHEGALLI